ncbi:MAG: hypothetical protein GY739_09700, partial [Mesoflavibacter sp.]|nr:hypothetical protein [Mesoflavibacter sp.]
MLYNLQNETDILKAETRFKWLKDNGKTIELLEKKQTRTDSQNRALHLFFTIISSQLNEMGLSFKYLGLKGQVMEMMHTPDLVKNHIWRPIQMSLFDIQSTRKINTQQINDIIDVITKFFGDKGVLIEFPSIET